MTVSVNTGDLAPYLGCRPLMFSIAYRMTGSVSDAEDIVQDGFIKLTRELGKGTVIESPEAFLTTVTTRLAITHLTSARVRRESYVGTWLPEPLVESGTEPDPAERAEMADSLSMAFLVLMESLTPAERAVFLLREVFGYDYPEIARITGKTEPNARQIFARARRHIDQAGSAPPSATPRAQGEEMARRFFDAAGGGDLAGLLDLLAPDVVMIGDGGGKAIAMSTTARGPLRVGRFLLSLFRRGAGLGVHGTPALVNGQPGVITRDAQGRVVNVFVLDVADGRVAAVRSIANPDKLSHLGPVSDLVPGPHAD